MSRVTHKFGAALYECTDTLLPSGIVRHFAASNVRLPVRFYRASPAGYERENYRFLKSALRTGDVILDIGAHVGVYTVAMAELVGETGKVHAFEPSPVSFSHLERVVRMNRREKRVALNRMAVSKQAGTAWFYIHGRRTSVSNSLVDDSQDDCVSIEVGLFSVDGYKRALGLARIAFVEIGAEGAAGDVLLASEGMLASDRPRLILGLHPRALALRGQRAADIARWLQDRGYCVRSPDGQRVVDASEHPRHPFDVHVSPA